MNEEISTSVMSKRGRLRQPRSAILTLALLLFWVIGMLVGIHYAYALAPAPSPIRTVSEIPLKRHPPTPAPTLTTVPSPAPTPSPTLTTTPLTKATVPPTTETMTLTGQVVASSGRTPGATPSTSSPVSPAIPHQEEVAVLPFAIGIGIAVGLLLLAVGLALRTGLPSRKRKLLPSGAAPWQRVRPADSDDSLSSSRISGQPLATPDALPYSTGKSFPSRPENLLLTKPPVPKRRSIALARHFSRPTRLKALHPGGQPPVAGDGSSAPTRQNGQSIVTIRERAREREKKHNDREVAQYT